MRLVYLLLVQVQVINLGLIPTGIYNFFRIDESQSFHGLVALKGVDEFYLLMNNLDLLLIAISKVGFEYRLDDSLLTINE